jgi:RNA polymerase sigma-70 factor, ECF subfamily
MKTLEQLSDETLANLAQRDPNDLQSRRAASVLFARYYGRVYIWAMRYVHDHDQALDLAQDIFLNAWRKISTYQGRARFFAWIYTITRNRCLNAIRKSSLLRDEAIELDEMSTSQPLPDKLLEDRMDAEAFQDLARKVLDQQEHDALYLRCYEHMPIDEITRVLEIPGATGARSVLQRARRKLAEALGRPPKEKASPRMTDKPKGEGD